MYFMCIVCILLSAANGVINNDNILIASRNVSQFNISDNIAEGMLYLP